MVVLLTSGDIRVPENVDFSLELLPCETRSKDAYELINIFNVELDLT